MTTSLIRFVKKFVPRVLSATIAITFLQSADAEEPSLQMQLPSGSRISTTTGTGTIRTSPNEATIVLGVKTFNRDLREGFKENEAILRRIIAVPLKYHVNKSDIQTSEIYVTEVTSSKSDGKTRLHKIERRITISVRNFETIPALLAEAVDAGANTIDSVQFSVSETRKFKDKARTLAIRAASEKATAMAAELHAKIGKPQIIQEVHALPRAYSRNYSNNITIIEPEADEGEDSTSEGIAKGRVKIDASVSVTFELID